MKNEAEITRRIECPSCGKKAKRVTTATLGALLQDEYSRQFGTDDQSCCASDGEGCTSIHTDTGWRFCESKNCDVVYFSEAGDTAFTKSQLKVAVGVKEEAGERPLCYCFQHSVASIKEELRTEGRSGALEDIKAKMQDPGCRCETENPSGSCCLGSVGKGIRIAQEELGLMDADIQLPPAPARTSGGKGEIIAKIGTVLSAIMASSCCWLPLVLLAVGVSGAGIVSTLEAYRPLFMVITFGFLGAAFYFTYRPRKAAARDGHGCCEPAPAGVEDRCEPAKGRFNMMTMNKVMLWAVTVMAVAVLFFPGYVGALFGAGDNNAVTSEMNRAIINVTGMTCEGCSATVAHVIRSVPGVKGVTVNYAKRQAIVGVAPSKPVPESAILTALKKAGYGGEFVATDESPGSTKRPGKQSGLREQADLPPKPDATEVDGGTIASSPDSSTACTLSVSGIT